MKNFDMTRFGRVLKLDFVEGLKPMLWGALAMLLLYLFFFWYAHNIAYDSNWYNTHPEKFSLRVCEAVGGFSAVALFFYFLIAASILYRNEQKKQQRIAWLMLPATNLEKFLSRWIYMVAFSLVGGTLTFFVADLIHIVYLCMANYPVKVATVYFFGAFPRMSGDAVVGLWVNVFCVTWLYALLAAIHAFFLLGGVFFKKFHFIATSATAVLLFAIWATLYNGSGLYLYSNGIPRILFYGGLTVIYTCCAALFTWLAYRLFCRWQVVTHKFVNL